MSANTLLKLGELAFYAQSAAFAEIERKTEWTWAEQERVGGTPALQYTGKSAQTISLPCVIYPAQTDGGGGRPGGSIDTLALLHGMGDDAKPLLLVSAKGTNHGHWCVKSIAETYTGLLPDGAPRKIDFTLTLSRYS